MCPVSPKSPPPSDLREACVLAAREIIAKRGLEGLSLREVARELGVSHQAPYKHYASRDHLLAAVMRRCFQDMAGYLDAGVLTADADADLRALGERYLRYAAEHPLEYRLMFGTPWPEPAIHHDLVQDAVHALDVLRLALHRISGQEAVNVDLDAMLIWSTLHGLASITHADVMRHLPLGNGVPAQVPAHVLDMLELALKATGKPQEHIPMPATGSQP
ncbi:MAG: TetR/AcrR family transcriptional regulator [Moraxellaceae bacterium]